MRQSGHKTRSAFDRYILSTIQIALRVRDPAEHHVLSPRLDGADPILVIEPGESNSDVRHRSIVKVERAARRTRIPGFAVALATKMKTAVTSVAAGNGSLGRHLADVTAWMLR